MSDNDDTTTDGVKLHYDESISTADHRHLDASGDGHPLGDEPLDWEVSNMRSLIRQIADDLYSGWDATIREYLANAETACRRVEKALDDDIESVFDADELIVDDDYQPVIEVEWDKPANRLTIKDNGIGMASVELDEIFRKIAHSAASMEGLDVGNFGMGALSFVQMEGEDDSMLLVTHSRQNDENYAANVSIAGAEPIMGKLGDDEYGTKFELTPKNPDWDIRAAVEKYAEWLRVPVIYTEIGEDGSEAYNEDYGGKTLYDEFDQEHIMADIHRPDEFTAIASPHADNRTISVSVPIERNGSVNVSKLDVPADVQIHDESGKVIEGPHAGKMPIAKSEYDARLIQQTDDIIGETVLDSDDVVGQTVQSGPNEGTVVLSNDDFDRRFPSGDTDQYLPKRDVSPDDVPGERRVIEGPHHGRTVVDSETWDAHTEDMLPRLVPETALTADDIRLPRPKSDRDSLQDNDPFWEFVSEEIDGQITSIVENLKEYVESADDPAERLRNLTEEDVRKLAP